MPKPADFDFTEDQIAQAIDKSVNFSGFAGETCGTCGTTANVLNGPGWTCICDAFNAQLLRGGPAPHANPDLGPTAAVIKQGSRRSQKWQAFMMQLTMPSGGPYGRRAVEGLVYLILAENGLYKIGRAVNLHDRFKSYNLSFPMKWERVHSFRSADYYNAEAQLHKKFASERVVGEWFRLSPDDVIYIQSLQDFALDTDYE